MKFMYLVDLIEGYKPTKQNEEETELMFIIAAKNTVTAQRMVNAMFKEAKNIIEWNGICIED